MKKRAYKKKFKNYSDSMILKLDNEMNNKEAFYYEKMCLYLTEHYIISFGVTFNAIDYNDIIWIYRSIQRVNGIKTNENIFVQDKYGKNYNIASISMNTKANKEAFEEIFNTISSKNNKMIVGYTKENKNKAKEIVKKYKDLNMNKL